MRALNRRHRRLHHRIGKRHIFAVQRRLTHAASQQEYARLLPIDEERQRDHAARWHNGAFAGPALPELSEQWMHHHIRNQHRSSRFECHAHFGILLEIHRQIAQRRIVKRRRHHRRQLARSRQHHRAAEQTDGARHATHQHMVNLFTREICADFAHDRHQRATRLRFLARLCQRFLHRDQLTTRHVERRSRTQIGADARQKLAGAQRLAHHIGRAAGQRLFDDFFGRARRRHQHWQIVPARFAFHGRQCVGAAVVEQLRIHQQQIGHEVARGIHRRRAAHHAAHVVAVLAQHPGNGLLHRRVTVGDDDSWRSHRRTCLSGRGKIQLGDHSGDGRRVLSVTRSDRGCTVDHRHASGAPPSPASPSPAPSDSPSSAPPSSSFSSGTTRATVITESPPSSATSFTP